MASGHGGTTSGRAACHASDGNGGNSHGQRAAERAAERAARKST